MMDASTQTDFDLPHENSIKQKEEIKDAFTQTNKNANPEYLELSSIIHPEKMISNSQRKTQMQRRILDQQIIVSKISNSVQIQGDICNQLYQIKEDKQTEDFILPEECPDIQIKKR